MQWLFSLLFIFTPFISLDGESLLRFDAASRTLLFFGSRIRIEEFYLLLLVILILVFCFLFITMIFGRVWCGWFCPQSIFCDIFEYISRKLRPLNSHFIAPAIENSLMLMFSFLVASNLIWYFIPPLDYIQRLITGTLGPIAEISLVTVSVLVFINLLLVRRKFCKTVCPYGRIQLMTMNHSTLTLEMNPELAYSCIRCGACVKTCPMQIDIREGLQIECINCGRCLDACRGVMEKLKKKQGVIHYAFGSKSRGEGKVLNAASILLATIIAALVVLLFSGISNRPAATLNVRQSGSGEARKLPDGSLINFYQAYIENRSTKTAVFDLDASALPGYDITLIGPAKNFSVRENANRRVDFIVKISPAPPVPTELKLKLLRERETDAETSVTILVK